MKKPYTPVGLRLGPADRNSLVRFVFFSLRLVYLWRFSTFQQIFLTLLPQGKDTVVKDCFLSSWPRVFVNSFAQSIRSDEGLTLETSAF